MNVKHLLPLLSGLAIFATANPQAAIAGAGWTNAASGQAKWPSGEITTDWVDDFGQSGKAVFTYGHVGCANPPHPSGCGGAWPYVFNGYGGQWIWKAQHVTPAEARDGAKVSFYGRFCIPEGSTLNQISLAISADNAYEVYYVDENNNRTSSVLAQDDEWRGVDKYFLPIPELTGTCQHFEVRVTNYGSSHGNPKYNPAGLSYDLRADYEEP